MFSSINKEYKIDVQKDVLPRLNGLGGIAILSQMSGFTPDMVFVAGTRSSSDAEALVNLFTSKLTKPNKNNYGGFEYYNLSSGSQPSFIGAINNAVVISSTSSAFTGVVDTIKNKKKNLAGNANFKKLRNSGGDVFAVTYFSGPNAYKMISPMMAFGAAQSPPGTMESVKQSFESIIVMLGNAEADATGIHYKMSTIMNRKQLDAPAFDIKELAKDVPADAGFFVSTNGYDKVWKAAKANMMNMLGAKTQYDEAAKEFKQTFNIDLDKDIMDNLKGMSFYIVPKEDLTSESLPGSFVFVLDVKDPVVMSKTLQKVHSAIAKMGYPQFKPLAISGGVGKAYIATFDGYKQMADALIGNKLVFVMSGTDAKGSLNSSIAALDSKNGISETSAFKKFSDKTSGKCVSLIYGDVSKLITSFSTCIPASDQKISAAITKKIGVFGITSTNSGKVAESSFEVPFLN